MKNSKIYKYPLYLIILIFLVISLFYLIITQSLYIKNLTNNQQFIHKDKDTLLNNSNNTTIFSLDIETNYLKRVFLGANLKYNDKGVPVLMYHSITNERGNELELSKELFQVQMSFLKDKNYTTLSLDELYDFLVFNKPVPEKSVIITFDDGYVDNYLNAYPILKNIILEQPYLLLQII